MRLVPELSWSSQQAFHIAIGTAAVKRPCIWPSIHPCRTPAYLLHSRSTELRSECPGQDPGQLGRRHARASSLSRRWDAGHQAVAVFGAAGPAVAHGELHLPQLAEVIEIARRPGAADTGFIRRRRRRQAGLQPVQRQDDQFQRGVRQTLRQGLVAGRPQRAEDAVHIGLLRMVDSPHAIAGRGVRKELLLEGREKKRLDKVKDDTAAHRRPQALALARRCNRDHVDRRTVVFAQLLQHLQARDVGQVDVEQHQVRPKVVDARERLGAGVCSGGDGKTRHAFDVGAVEVGDPVVVVHDKRADHVAAVTFSGSRTVNTAPPSLTTLTLPPCRWATWRTSARPKPRRLWPGPDFVLNPSWKIWPLRLSGTPEPESWTLITTSSCCWVTDTLTHRSVLDDPAASSALSIRLPSSVMRSSLSRALRVIRVSSLALNSIPLSEATAAFASRSAPRTGSPTRSSSASVSSWCTPEVWAMSFIASSPRPIWTSPAMVCRRLEYSCACARSASVRLSTPSPRARPVSSVESRKVATWPISRPWTRAALRLATSTRSPARSTSSSSFKPPERNFSKRPGGRTCDTRRPTQSAGSASKRRASSLARVMVPSRSVAMAPSCIPCKLASRSSRSPAISNGSSPKVWRLRREASSIEPATPRPRASSTVTAKPGSSPSSWLKTAVSRKPTETMPITPPPWKIGALPRAETPSVPRCTPTHVLPARTVPGSSSTGLPIRAGLVCEYRMPARSVTTT